MFSVYCVFFVSLPLSAMWKLTEIAELDVVESEGKKQSLQYPETLAEST